MRVVKEWLGAGGVGLGVSLRLGGVGDVGRWCNGVWVWLGITLYV